ncbi:MAG: hypothetical protein WKG07_18290 [Hymenobacter sp.]
MAALEVARQKIVAFDDLPLPDAAEANPLAALAGHELLASPAGRGCGWRWPAGPAPCCPPPLPARR